MSPIVSVLIPVYNAEKFIGAALRSAGQQTLTNIEILVCNDSSPDSTGDIITRASVQDPRIRVLHHVCRQGEGFSRNVLLDHAQGEWIAFLDADDLMHPQRLESLVTLANRYQAEMAFDNMMLINHDGTRYVGPVIKNVAGDGLLSAVSFIERSFGLGFSWGYLQPMIKTNFLREKGILYDTSIRIGLDFLFEAMCLIHGARCMFTPCAYYYYRQHGQGISQAGRGTVSIEQIMNATKKLAAVRAATDDAQVQAALRKGLAFLAEMYAFADAIGHLRAKNLAAAVPQMTKLNSRFLVIFLTRLQQKLASRIEWQLARPFSELYGRAL